MGRWVTALFATAACAVLPAAMSQSSYAHSVFRSVLLPPSAQKHVSVSCPAGAVAVGAGVKSPGSGTTTLGIWWSGARVADFRVANARGNPSRRMTVAATCLGSPGGNGAPRYRLTRVKKTTVVRGGAEKHASLACPRGTIAAGAGFDLINGSLEVRRQTRTPSAFSFTVRNRGSRRPLPAVLYGSCLTIVLPPGAHRVSLHATVITETTPVRPGAQSLSQACPRDWFGLATGYSLPPGVTLGGSFAVAGGGKWSLTNDGSSQALVDLQLACGRVA
jgi:hypothetical protein